MSVEATGKKRRKVYLDVNQPFVVPRSTLWYNSQQPGTSSVHAEEPPPTDSLEDDSQPTSSDHSNQQPAADFVECGTDEGPSVAAEDCYSSDDSDIAVDTHADNRESVLHDDAVPVFDDAELLAQCVRDFGDKTLPGSSTTVASAVVLIMSFIVAHGLTWSAAEDLLKLVDSLFGSNASGLPQSKYLLRKLWAPKCAIIIKNFYYCDICFSLLNENAGRLACEICQTSEYTADVKRKGSFFSIMNLKEQFRHVIAKTKDVLFQNLTALKNHYETGQSSITGVATGGICRTLREKELQKWSDLTLTINTDGSPLFKSSNASVWPIQLSINELPLAVRNENCMLAGLWFGRKHPDMLLFLGKFIEEVQGIGELVWRHDSLAVYSRVYPVCVCVDAPARAAVGNHTQFNGLFGCPWCLTSAELEDGRRLYLETEGAVQRTSEGVRRDMELALRLGTPVNGLKGPSPLMKLPHLDLVWCYTVEYMHCVLLGVTRQFTDYWLDSSNHHEGYYIGRPSTLEIVNNRLLSICPPHHCTRLPRSLQERRFWKAHEWKNWLLFYCLPCCKNILPLKYWKHFALLCEAIFILLQEELSQASINHADRLLQRFTSRAAKLYGRLCMTFNVHQLTHLAEAARNFGPLWGHSAFTFESGNGHIIRLVTAATGVPEQILERVIMSQEVQLLCSFASVPSHIKQLCITFLGYPRVGKACEIDGATFFGTPKHVTALSASEAACLEYALNGVPNVKEHFRFAYHGTVFHSAQYKRSRKSNSTAFESLNGQCFFIKRIFEVTDTTSLHNGQVILLCGRIVCQESDIELPPHIIECFRSLHNPLVAIRLSEISKPCILVSFSDDENFMCKIPNLFERD
ncbi:uncharacterized protein LOC135378756 [Ornithodoros turicata]|uniref:uncharacterized protein LOC135378756 n=1 Tax=Ornithodoros turicata TaxID=34597 RepID=UPI0031386FC0